MSGLLSLAPDQGLPLLQRFLSGKDEAQREMAALALGESGRGDALRVLLEALEAIPLASDRAAILRALGLHRSDEALEALLEKIARGEMPDATAAISALGHRRFEPVIRERVHEAAQRNVRTAVVQVYKKVFPDALD
jgi:HEAT repeat protein